jgi:predicted O-methyltransferase YrrM
MAFSHLLRPEVQAFIREHQHDDVNQLALRAKQDNPLPMTDIIRQIGARQKAKEKLPTWACQPQTLFSPPLSVEQSSSEAAARYKASLISGETLVDLTGGFGVDAFFFAGRFEKVVHVERNKELSALAAHNFAVLGAGNITCLHADAEAYLNGMPALVDWIYLDPARRDPAQGKVFRLEDCEPDVLRLLPLLLSKCRRLLLKTSPMLDIDLAVQQLTGVQHVRVVALENDCKEVLYELSSKSDSEPVITAVNLRKDQPPDTFSFTRHEERMAEVTLSDAQAFVYEPNVALLKAGAFQSLARHYGLSKLHVHTHLYTSHLLCRDFPGRIFTCEAVSRLDKKALKVFLPEGKAHVTVRNFPVSVAEIRRQTGIREGGDVYLLATTDRHNRKIILVTRKV